MKVTIDKKEFEAKEGETVLRVALRNGIEIPHFCFHPGLSIAGNCRICLVKVIGLPKLMPSCNLVVAPKMVVETEGQEVQRARAMIMQFILLNHPVDCGICDKAGECRLQDYQARYGAAESNSVDPKKRRRKLYDLSPRISLDNERCILCSRCVRFTAEVSGTHALGIVERGGQSFVDRLESAPFDDPYSDNVIDLCPTGALLSRDFLYRSRVWYLEPVRSVCTGCSRGCSINVWRRRRQWQLRSTGAEMKRAAYRVTAYNNPEINGPWICNKGFDLHQAMARERVETPMIGGRPAALDEAIAQARRLLDEAKNPAALVSAHASNEELDAFQAALASRLRVYTREDCQPAPGEVVEDKLLIKADKNPNSHGVRSRFGWSPYDVRAGHDFVLVWGEFTAYATLGSARLIHLASFAAPRDAHADVLIPISTTFERGGSFCNFEGKLNRFEKVFEKAELVQHASDVFRSLGG